MRVINSQLCKHCGNNGFRQNSAVEVKITAGKMRRIKKSKELKLEERLNTKELINVMQANFVLKI